jgi:MFS family permease
MFMLSPDVDDRKSNMTLAAGALAIAVAVAGGILAIWLVSGLMAVLSITAVLGLATIVLYGRDVIEIFGGRKRRQLELNTRMAVLSFASLAGAALLGVVLVLTGAFAAYLGAFAFLAIFGWLSGLVLAKPDKIVAFLTWLETYGPVMGRAPTPRVQDLVSEARASKWFVIYYAAVWFGTLMLLAGQPWAFRAAAAMMAVGLVGIVREVIRARRLADVESRLRLPAGACAPLLLCARS